MATNRASRLWTPSQYLRFGNDRLRPATDLLAQARQALSAPPALVVDLGCGTGNIAPFVADAWPHAALHCVDSSPTMLAAAKAAHAKHATLASTTTYTQSDFETFSLHQKPDLIYSNAALHWVSFTVHTTLLPRLLSLLNPGGVLAFSMPDTRRQPSHLLMQQAAQQLGFSGRIATTRWVTTERDGSEYYSLLSPHTTSLNMWHSKYAMVMEGENPVADFTASTGLGPYVDSLGGKESEDGQRFVAKYRELIAEAYPKQQDGKTLFEFNRFFVVATV
ncbi:hypothetical protein HDU98_009483 [Podochytrium sp. JEL0797]|nr:hypothetical protein HDU98_009483 [Podochytrium sp. JEL0797]